MLSFIVPAYNEEIELPATIESIRAAAHNIDPLRGGFAVANNYEIIVVDDASTDATAEIARKAGAEVVAIDRRQIAAARNAGARAARGDILFFVDADTRIRREHVTGAIEAVNGAYAGGSARVVTDGTIPLWGRLLMKTFCAVYFANNLGAGAFLFTTRENFDKIGGFNEDFYIGEEVYFSLALRKLGRFKILRTPVITSGRKLRMYSARQILVRSFGILLHGKRAALSRDRLDLWYEGKRETKST
ncbi:MAG TPA: glycosyltransferase [Chthoniobacterales bacterium]|nr:glycosyltransferase [Chthoniobacterales bacterium]